MSVISLETFFDAMRGRISGDVDLSITGGPEAVEAMAVLLTEELGLHLIGAEVTEPQNVAVGKVRLKATLVIPRDLLRKLLSMRENR